MVHEKTSSTMTDQKYMLSDQYKDSSNLNARINLHERFSTNPQHWQHWTFSQLALTPGSHILELGCGPADLWKNNLTRIPADCSITLSDFSAGMLQDARKQLGAAADRFNFQVIDVQDIPFEDAHFDYIIANHMLYHVPDRPQALAEIRRVLRPDGHFYAATNGEEHLQEISQLVNAAGISSNGMLSMSALRKFSLENGTQQLALYFTHIEQRLHPNNLAVTESAPLLAFITASIPQSLITQEQIAQLQEMIDQEIARNGSFHVTKSTGLFICQP